ncbi:MFS transporter [Allosphingosinicella flava]|uniref:MFS transporter n=2 Tax=Allosphingosinicella flava TaxID=2771430 RepID=A0A7T2LNN2_9SPHN|nr:MFS transporter [Sphingosinicella flava]
MQAGSGTARTVGGNRVLAILLLAYIFNFVDRQILSILQIPIKAELGLSDGQIGLMGGLAFALLYSGLGIPVAWLADRKDRVTIISVSLGVWSAFTALCGTAQNFWQLFLCRMGVGVGEAGGVAPAYALISDYFPPEKRARALAIFSLGIPIGSALGVFFGGWLASNIDWRSAFMIVGLAGIALVPLVLLGIRDPGRGRFDSGGKAGGEAPPFATVARTVARKPSFWLLSFGAACGSIVGYGLAFWLPPFLTRSFGLALVDISWFYGSVALVGGMAGVWLGGWFGDKLGSIKPSGYPLIPAICFLLAAPVYAAGIFAPSLPVAWVMFAIGTALGLAWLGPVVAAVQHIVPPAMRATASASFLLINNLLGIGFGIYVLGFMSDRMTATHGDEALKYSMFYGLGFYLLSATLYALAARRIGRDWHRVEAA